MYFCTSSQSKQHNYARIKHFMGKKNIKLLEDTLVFILHLILLEMEPHEKYITINICRLYSMLVIKSSEWFQRIYIETKIARSKRCLHRAEKWMCIVGYMGRGLKNYWLCPLGQRLSNDSPHQCWPSKSNVLSTIVLHLHLFYT